MVPPPPLLDMLVYSLVEEIHDEANHLADANFEITTVMVISMTEHIPPIDNPKTSAIPDIIQTHDEDPLAEFEGLLSGSFKSSPKSVKSYFNESLE